MHEIPSWSELVAALPLFRDAIICGAFAGVTLGYLGVFILLRRMVFVTAAITQSAGLGVVLGILIGSGHDHSDTYLVLSAIGASLAAAGVLALDASRVALSRESVLALVWLVGSGGTVLLGERIAQEAHDVSAILFGTAVLVLPQDLAIVGAISALALGLAVWARRGLVFSGYDRDGAQVQGVPVRVVELTFLVLVTLEVSVTTRALGALPVFAFSVLPAMMALLVSRSLGPALVVAPLAGLFAAVVGYGVAFFLSFPVGAAQAVVAAGLVLVGLTARVAIGSAPA
jgi:zinc transport system permease protein